MSTNRSGGVIVVGGGLAGLAAAAYLARAGRPVTLLERAEEIGGRARTRSLDAFLFNLGPHALYRRGQAAEVLRELGVNPSGTRPSGSGGYAVRAGVLHTLPAGVVSLLSTGLLRAREKMETARLLSALRRGDFAARRDVPLSTWLADISSPVVRELMAALVRVTSYVDDPARHDAAAALAQARLGLTSGVLYLDGGWQTLVDGLRRVAEDAGARILSRRHAMAVECDRGVRGVRLDDGALLDADAVVLAGSPQMAGQITAGRSTVLSTWAREAVPVHAASLDLALSALPRPHATFALGIDQPLYASVHSAAARLAPAGGALVHVMRYGGLRGDTPGAVEAQLETLMDALQPGWRAHVVHRRFLPDLLVSNAVVQAGGTAGRPGPSVPDLPGVHVAGDWVGPEGMLADASLASGRQAARAALAGAARAVSAA